MLVRTGAGNEAGQGQRQGAQAEQEQEVLACCKLQRKTVSFHLTATESEMSFVVGTETGVSV